MGRVIGKQSIEVVLNSKIMYPVTLGFGNIEAGELHVLAVTGNGYRVETVGIYCGEFAKVFGKQSENANKLTLTLVNKLAKEINKFMRGNRDDIPKLSLSTVMVGDHKTIAYYVN